MSFQIAPGTRTISSGDCFVIAEAGVNHNGEVSIAHALVDTAADSGADAVKFQTFEPARLVVPGTPQLPYQIARTGGDETQMEMLERLTLPRDAFIQLARHAARRGIIFLSTAFDEESADFLENLGVPAFKTASGEITNHGFLAHIARKGRPMLVSTGMASLEEVEAAVEIIRGAGGPPIALLHCVTSYPADPTDCNLRAMDAMAGRFGCPVGWSDHTEGIDIGIAAVARGAAILEKHFTLDRMLPGPDHAASLEPAALRELILAVRRVAGSLGDGRKRPAAAELGTRLIARRSLYLRHALEAGHCLQAGDLIALRPATGISPALLHTIVGRCLCSALPAGAQLAPEHFR